MQHVIEVRLKRSRYYIGLLTCLLLVCLLAICLSRPDNTVLLAALLWTLCNTWDAYQRHFLLRAKSSIIAIRLESSAWSLQTANGEWHQAMLLGSRSTVTAHILCLTFKLIEPQRHLSKFLKPSVCLFNDSANTEELRQLRVALLSSASEGGAGRNKHSIFGHWR